MRKLLPILLSAFLVFMITSTRAAIVVITQEGNTFSPDNVSVQVGDTVRWVWTSGSHTTTSATIPVGAAAWDSQLTSSVTQFDYKVTTEGLYNYVCTPHAAIGMIGTFTATATLGTNDKLSLSSAKLYPNPARESTVLKLNSEKSGEGIVTIYDLLGNQMSRNDVSIRTGGNNIQVSLDNIIPGIYFVEFKYNQAAVVRRLVKSR